MVIDEGAYGPKSRIVITTARFDPTEYAETGMLVGNRTIWQIDDDQMTAKVIGIRHWTARSGKWVSAEMAVPNIHRTVLASVLMARWGKGKLRGRITDRL